MSERNSLYRSSDPDGGGSVVVGRSATGIRSYGSVNSSNDAPDDNEEDNASTTTTTSSGMGGTNQYNRNSHEMRSTMPVIQKMGFGLGHVYNDLCAGVWFSYTLVFLKGVLQIPGTEAGALVWWGQVVDAISTPICGIITDRYSTKRRWHIVGTFLVVLSFPAIFSICPYCDEAPSYWPPLYYAIVVAIFQFAWPLVQIANLAMIPELSRTQRDRMDLTSIRYAASVISSVIVYIVTWLIIRSKNVDEKNIGPADWFRFRDISLILTLIGVSMTVLFHFSLSLSNYEQRRALSISQRSISPAHNERGRDGDDRSGEEEGTHLLANSQANRRRRDYLKSPLLYQNAFLYVFSRLFMTSALLYMPLWLDERNKQPVEFLGDNSDPGEKTVEHLATVPLVSFVASFVASIVMNMTHRFIGHQVSYMLGSVIGLAASAWVALGTPSNASQFHLFGVAVLLGAGSSITMISSLSITADMIGQNSKLGGFVYSAVTFFDKLITGFVVIIIEAIKCTDCQEYYKFVLAYACGVAALLGLITLISLKLTKTCMRTRETVLVN